MQVLRQVQPHAKELTIMKTIFSRFFNDESGATAIEYGLIAALVAVVIIGGVTLVGDNLSTTFNSVATALGGTT